MFQAFLYIRNPEYSQDPNSNHYACPLAFSPVIDVVTQKVIRIDGMPTGNGLEVRKTKPMKLPKGNEYMPEYQKLRTDVKPLSVVQPEGASFKVTTVGETGQIVEWQKWRFRLGFNQREGMVMYDVSSSTAKPSNL